MTESGSTSTPPKANEPWDRYENVLGRSDLCTLIAQSLSVHQKIRLLPVNKAFSNALRAPIRESIQAIKRELKLKRFDAIGDQGELTNTEWAEMTDAIFGHEPGSSACDRALEVVIKLRLSHQVTADLVEHLVAKGGRVKEVLVQGSEAGSYYNRGHYVRYRFQRQHTVSQSPILLATLWANGPALRALLLAYPGGSSKAVQESYCLPCTHLNEDYAIMDSTVQSALSIACQSPFPNGAALRVLADCGANIFPQIRLKDFHCPALVQAHLLEIGMGFNGEGFQAQTFRAAYLKGLKCAVDTLLKRDRALIDSITPDQADNVDLRVVDTLKAAGWQSTQSIAFIFKKWLTDIDISADTIQGHVSNMNAEDVALHVEATIANSKVHGIKEKLSYLFTLFPDISNKWKARLLFALSIQCSLDFQWLLGQVENPESLLDDLHFHPLHDAIAIRSELVVRSMLHSRLFEKHMHKLDPFGRTALQLAHDYGRRSLVALLEAEIARACE